MIIIKWISKEKILRESFKHLKKDLSELRAEIINVEEDLFNIRKQIEKIGNNSEKEAKNEKISVSQASLNPETLRLLIKETVSEEVREALKEQHTKAASVFPTETEAEMYDEISTNNIPKEKETMKDNLKEELLKSYERNRKNIVKQQILAETEKGNITKIALRDIVVDQKKYCSKATFYRYMDELELERLITFQRKKGKNIIQIQI